MKKHQSTRKDKNIKAVPAAENPKRVIRLQKNSRQQYAFNGFDAVPVLTARRLQCLILNHFQEVIESADP